MRCGLDGQGGGRGAALVEGLTPLFGAPLVVLPPAPWEACAAGARCLSSARTAWSRSDSSESSLPSWIGAGTSSSSAMTSSRVDRTKGRVGSRIRFGGGGEGLGTTSSVLS